MPYENDPFYPKALSQGIMGALRDKQFYKDMGSKLAQALKGGIQDILPTGTHSPDIAAKTGAPIDPAYRDKMMNIALAGITATTPYGMAKELSRKLEKAGINHTVDKSRTTKSAYLEIETGKGEFDYPEKLRFSDHSGDYLALRNGEKVPDTLNYAADVFPGAHTPEYAEEVVNNLIKKIGKKK